MTRPALTLLAAAIGCATGAAWAQTAPAPAAAASSPQAATATLAPVNVTASADASAQGLSPAYPGGQVARGGRAGILGTRDNIETPFSITSYTNELIQDKQAKSVGDVLQNDAGVRTARGFGNFQESYFIRGFLLSSDDVAYNGLYSLLPRQYIATELFERVEVLRGASAFLIGANPGGGGIGGAINLLPKRATNEPLNRVTLGIGDSSQYSAAADISRRFGPDQSTGIRLNVAGRSGSPVDDESTRLGLVSVGADWRSRDVRVSADLGYQDNKLKRSRTNVSVAGLSDIPDAPDSSSNFAQPWSYSNEKDTFGTLRAEWDINSSVTAWGAYGLRRSKEANSLANLTVTNAESGDGNTQRFDNTRKDHVDTGEVGLRGKFVTGPVKHDWVVSGAYFQLEKKNAFAFDFTTLDTNLYTPTSYAQPQFSTAGTFFGGDLDDPRRTGRTRLLSAAVGDTLGMLDDTLLVTLGARNQKIDVTDYAYGTAEETNRYKKSRTSPLVGVVYRLGKQVSLYGNYVEGLTQGQTAPELNGDNEPVANHGQSLAPYVSRQKEIGVKYDSGRYGANLALFSTERPRDSAVNADNVFTNAGKDRHQGVEANVFGRPIAGLRVLGGLTWLDAKQRNTGNDAIDGNRVIGVPRFQGNVGAEWDIPGVQGLAVDGRVLRTGATYADDANTLRVPAWTRLDLGVRYFMTLQDRLVTLRARVDNVTDRDYWSSVGGYPGAGYLVVGAPRTFTFSASMDF